MVTGCIYMIPKLFAAISRLWELITNDTGEDLWSSVR